MFKTRDPLLGAAKVVVALLIALCVFVMSMLAIAFGATLTVGREEILADLVASGAPDYAYWVVALAIGMIVGLFWLAFRFLRDLWSIIGSVDEGDPFREENADLLNRMGWTALGAYITAFLIALQASWLNSFEAGRISGFDLEMDLGVGGILLFLTLFILARVFKIGATMREDLEGTV